MLIVLLCSFLLLRPKEKNQKKSQAPTKLPSRNAAARPLLGRASALFLA